MMYLHNNKRWGIIFIDHLMSWGLDISASWRLASKRWSAQCWLPEPYDQPTHPFVDSSDEYLEQDGRMRVPLKETDVEGGKKRNKHLPESKRSGYWTRTAPLHCWIWSTQQPSHRKRSWCWERLRAGGEGRDRGWEGWMASLTQWSWVWANSER